MKWYRVFTAERPDRLFTEGTARECARAMAMKNEEAFTRFVRRVEESGARPEWIIDVIDDRPCGWKSTSQQEAEAVNDVVVSGEFPTIAAAAHAIKLSRLQELLSYRRQEIAREAITRNDLDRICEKCRWHCPGMPCVMPATMCKRARKE